MTTSKGHTWAGTTSISGKDRGRHGAGNIRYALLRADSTASGRTASDDAEQGLLSCRFLPEKDGLAPDAARRHQRHRGPGRISVHYARRPEGPLPVWAFR